MKDIEESGNAWMFYHHYNPELIDAVTSVLRGSQVEDVVDGLLERKASLALGIGRTAGGAPGYQTKAKHKLTQYED